MNDKQEKLLKKKGFRVLKEFNVIEEPDLDNSLFHIYFDDKTFKFGLQIIPVMIDDVESMKSYSTLLNNRIALINTLNKLGGE